MILGWRSGTSLGRWVMVDPVFPWPGLGPGRAAVKHWSKWHTRQRAVDGSEGPMLSPTRHGLTTAAVEADAYAELRIWPVTKEGLPRPWIDRPEGVWYREVVNLIARPPESGMTVCTEPLPKVRRPRSSARR